MNPPSPSHNGNATNAPPSAMLPTLGSSTMYRAGEIGVYHALEIPGPCEAHDHAEVQIMITFPRASYCAVWETELGTIRRQQFTGAAVNIVPSGQMHGFDWQTQDRLLSLFVAPQFLARLAEEVGGASQPELRPQWGAKNPLIQQIGHDLWHEFRDEAAPNPLYIESVATVLAVHLLRQQMSAPSPAREHTGGLAPRKLRQTLDYIHAHLAQPITLETLAQTASLERHHFAHAFKQSTGTSPYEFVLRCRIERALELLTATDTPIGDIARVVGFQDASQFARQFKRIVGVSPRARREHQA